MTMIFLQQLLDELQSLTEKPISATIDKCIKLSIREGQQEFCSILTYLRDQVSKEMLKRHLIDCMEKSPLYLNLAFCAVEVASKNKDAIELTKLVQYITNEASDEDTSARYLSRICFISLNIPVSNMYRGISDSLVVACQRGYDFILEVILPHCKSKRINAGDWYDNIPIFCAIDSGHVSTLGLLLQYGASVNLRNKYYGDTPLHFVCRNHRKRDETYDRVSMLNLLLKYGADVNGRDDYDGNTPLHHACQNQLLDVCKILVAHGADVNAVTIVNYTALHFCASHRKSNILLWLLQYYEGNVNAVNQYSRTPLLEQLSYQPNVEKVRILLQYGADANIRDYKGRSALHYSIHYTNNRDYCVSSYIDTLNTLLEHGVTTNMNINILDNEGDTPLQYAIRNRCINCAKSLLHYRANSDILDKDGYTPLQLACKFNNVDIILLLIEYEVLY